MSGKPLSANSATREGRGLPRDELIGPCPVLFMVSRKQAGEKRLTVVIGDA
jgi:hypothetical protein